MAQSGLGDVFAWSISPVAVAFVLFMDLIEVLVAFLQAYIFNLLKPKNGPLTIKNSTLQSPCPYRIPSILDRQGPLTYTPEKNPKGLVSNSEDILL